MFCDQSTDRVLLPNENEVAELLLQAFAAKNVNGVETGFMNIESLKTIVFHLSRLLIRMIDHTGHPGEKT